MTKWILTIGMALLLDCKKDEPTISHHTIGTSTPAAASSPQQAREPQARRASGSPVELAREQRGLSSIAADATYVFWTAEPARIDVDSKGADGKVMKVPLSGGDAVQVAPKRGIQNGLALGASRLVWIDSEGTFDLPAAVMAAPVAGGRNLKIATTKPVTQGAIDVVGDDAVWVQLSGLYTVPVSGGQPRELVKTASEPNAIGVSPSWIVYEDAGKLMKVPVGGGPAVQLAKVKFGGVWGIAVDDTNAYWTEDGENARSGLVARVPLAGGPPVVLASNLVRPRGIVLERNHVFWVTNGDSDGMVVNVHKAGGRPAALATGQRSPWDIAVVGPRVYWTNSGSGSVMKIELMPGE